jgi:hypothetical protein
MLNSVAPRNLPAWLNEGLAMYCEGRDGALSGRRLAAAKIFVPLEVLQTSFSRLTALQAVIAYEESAFAARALLDRIGPTGLGQLLQDLSGGQTMEQAIERFGVTFAAFESDLERRVGVQSRSAPPSRRSVPGSRGPVPGLCAGGLPRRSAKREGGCRTVVKNCHVIFQVSGMSLAQ